MTYTQENMNVAADMLNKVLAYWRLDGRYFCQLAWSESGRRCFNQALADIVRLNVHETTHLPINHPVALARRALCMVAWPDEKHFKITNNHEYLMRWSIEVNDNHAFEDLRQILEKAAALLRAGGIPQPEPENEEPPAWFQDKVVVNDGQTITVTFNTHDVHFHISGKMTVFQKYQDAMLATLNKLAGEPEESLEEKPKPDLYALFPVADVAPVQETTPAKERLEVPCLT